MLQLNHFNCKKCGTIHGISSGRYAGINTDKGYIVFIGFDDLSIIHGL